mmetsp:Transcript_7993/g.18570  ORF Transcript_7993/g.18570 Transcript_7993/m.18570 type:complete len:221 (+) Transcript_7993:745-1407(+)
MWQRKPRGAPNSLSAASSPLCTELGPLEIPQEGSAPSPTAANGNARRNRKCPHPVSLNWQTPRSHRDRGFRRCNHHHLLEANYIVASKELPSSLLGVVQAPSWPLVLVSSAPSFVELQVLCPCPSSTVPAPCLTSRFLLLQEARAFFEDPSTSARHCLAFSLLLHSGLATPAPNSHLPSASGFAPVPPTFPEVRARTLEAHSCGQLPPAAKERSPSWPAW